MSEWLPIDTAPRGGTNVLVLAGETIPEVPDIRVACFITQEEAFECGGYPYAGWMTWNNDCDWDLLPEAGVTHWQPLPATPLASNISGLGVNSALSPATSRSAVRKLNVDQAYVERKRDTWKARAEGLAAELERRDQSENRNCLNWGPCSRHDGHMEDVN